MDSKRFDTITRALAIQTGRRSLLAGAVTMIFAGVPLGARAACPLDQVQRGRGKAGACVCKVNGRPPKATGGTCPCPVGEERCGADCVDPATYARDPLNCGGCGQECSSNRPFCVRGTCVECRDDANCDDGVDCTADACVDGDCQATPIDAICNDGNPCTFNQCDPLAGCRTTPAPIGLPCSDGLLCNGLEVCDGAGTCIAGAPVDCGPCLICGEESQNCDDDPSQNGDPCGNQGHICADGSCVCPADQRDCDGSCRECCSDADCPSERPDCNDGACRCLGSGLACSSSAQCCPGNLCLSGFCCTRSGQQCVTGEQCCSGGCDFDFELGHRVCG